MRCRLFAAPVVVLIVLALAGLACGTGSSPTSEPVQRVSTAPQVPTSTSAPTATQEPAPAPTEGSTAVPAAAGPSVAIVQVYNKGYTEYVVISNQGTAAADLSGWMLRENDDTVAAFVFPDGFSLAPSAEVRIYSGKEGRVNNPPESFDWTEQNVWDNDGETARLFDAAGNQVDEFRY